MNSRSSMFFSSHLHFTTRREEKQKNLYFRNKYAIFLGSERSLNNYLLYLAFSLFLTHLQRMFFRRSGWFRWSWWLRWSRWFRWPWWFRWSRWLLAQHKADSQKRTKQKQNLHVTSVTKLFFGYR